MRYRIVLAVLVLLLSGRVSQVQAAAEVHRLNVVISGVPTQMRATDFNTMIDDVNRTRVEPFGLEPLSRIKLSWLFDAEVRYFVRQDLAVGVGVSRMRAKTSQEYLPTIGESNTLSSEVTSVPVHAGAAYYFTPYNQGDFQARAYVGAGFMNLVYNRASLRWEGSGIPGGRGFGWTASNDGPGYYGEVGAHLFFASRYSVLLSALHRSNQVRNLVDENTGALIVDSIGRPVSLDVGGTGFRLAVGIGL